MNSLHLNRVGALAAEVEKVGGNVVVDAIEVEGVLVGAKTLEELEEHGTRIQMDMN